MPYAVERRGDQYCVIKIDDGTVMGCHDNPRDAYAQIAAIEASEQNRYRVEKR